MSQPPSQHTRQPSMRSPRDTGLNRRRNLVSTCMQPTDRRRSARMALAEPDSQGHACVYWHNARRQNKRNLYSGWPVFQVIMPGLFWGDHRGFLGAGKPVMFSVRAPAGPLSSVRVTIAVLSSRVRSRVSGWRTPLHPSVGGPLRFQPPIQTHCRVSPI